MITTLYDLDAEAAVVGSLLLDGAAITRIAGILRPEDFYRERHAQLYGAALALHQAGRPIDQVTLAGELERRGILTQVGGRAHLHELEGATPTAANSAEYAAIVHQKALARRELEALEQRAQAIRTSAPHPQPAPGLGPYAHELEDFLELRIKGAEPLVGDSKENLLPTGGLLLVVAKGGKGKTTFSVDAAFHFVSGIEWLGFSLSRPLRVLIVENEGPMRPFQVKLAAKAASWPHKITGALFIKTLDWGAFNFDNEGEVARLRAFIEQERVDLVIGDPLDSLGLHGVGSPDDTRTFVQHLVEVGLTRDVAFWLLGHPRKTAPGGLEDQDELDRASGAWGGRPDTMLHLQKLDGGRSRLSFPKIRWAPRPREAYILGFDPDSESFIVAATEQPEAEERDLVQEVRALLSDSGWRTAREIAEKTKGGIGARRETIEQLLTGRAELFVRAAGKDIGRRSNIREVWGLREVVPTLGPHVPLHGPAGGKVELEHVVPPIYRDHCSGTTFPPGSTSGTTSGTTSAAQLPGDDEIPESRR